MILKTNVINVFVDSEDDVRMEQVDVTDLDILRAALKKEDASKTDICLHIGAVGNYEIVGKVIYIIQSAGAFNVTRAGAEN